MSDHAPLAPSAAHRWARCPGSVRMTKDLPSKISRPALKGTAMHQVFESCIKRQKHPSIFLDNVFNIEGEDVTFDEDMVRWTTEAVEWVQKYKTEHKGCHVISEMKLKTGKVLDESLSEEIWGTPDLTIHSPDELCVFDLKGGYVDVDVVDNYQLILYAIGAVAHFEDAMGVEIKNIRLVIHQPRTGGPKEMLVFRETLNAWAEFLTKAAKEALQKNAPLRASEEACKWCPVIGSCPAAHQRAIELAKNTNWPEVAESITEPQLVAVLERATFIRKFLDAAEQYAVTQLTNGHHIPGFKLVPSRKHRRWKDEEVAGKLLGPTAFTKKLCTPAQAEKKFPKLDLDPYVETPEGEPTLAPQSDPRPTIPFRELKVIGGGKS